MAYITREPDKLICSHPQVKKIWDYGMLARASARIASYGIAIELNDGTRKDFNTEMHGMADADKLIDKVEQYLQTINDL